MTRVLVFVRDPGRSKPHYSLQFDLPEVPTIGSYISLTRPDTGEWSEDLVVRHVWWRLQHPETRGGHASEDVQVGVVTKIVVECDPALGPNSTDAWRATIEDAESRGVEIERFDLQRLSVRQRDMPGKT